MKQASLRNIGEAKSAAEAVCWRRTWLEKKTATALKHIGRFSLDPEATKGRNLENMIGAVQVPLGVAGPIKIKNSKLRTQNYYVPLATTEGALVASVNRGGKAITNAGGCRVRVREVGATRGPVFRVNGIEEVEKLEHWLRRSEPQLKKVAGETSNHLRLLGFRVQSLGKSVWVRFRFETQEAMGMNMVTKATQAIVDLVEKRLKIRCVALSGNACVDKKVAWSNGVLGRGKQVWAEVVVPKRLVERVLKTSAKAIVEVVKRKSVLGSMLNGVVGGNGHFANIVAAVFLATGQDMGHVGECSVGFVDAEVLRKDRLYFGVFLPDVMVGVVGGGTSLATQQEGLSILGLAKAKKGDAVRLAEVVGATVLAGELSLTAALAAGDLAVAHERLGRGGQIQNSKFKIQND